MNQPIVKGSANSEEWRLKRRRDTSSSTSSATSTPASTKARPLEKDSARLASVRPSAIHQAASRRRSRPRATNSSDTPSTLQSTCEPSITHSGTTLRSTAMRCQKAGVAPEITSMPPTAKVTRPRNSGASCETWAAWADTKRWPIARPSNTVSSPADSTSGTPK